MRILGFKVRRRRGRMCMDIRVFSRVREGLKFCVWYEGLPRCVVVSMYSE